MHRSLYLPRCVGALPSAVRSATGVAAACRWPGLHGVPSHSACALGSARRRTQERDGVHVGRGAAVEREVDGAVTFDGRGVDGWCLQVSRFSSKEGCCRRACPCCDEVRRDAERRDGEAGAGTNSHGS
ncbi:hypothetical protein SEVIR_9G097250v4 [Setaria viridis]